MTEQYNSSCTLKVLFVSSGNSNTVISPIVRAQGESLKEAGLEIDYYTINGKGIISYLKNIPKLKSYTQKKDFEIIHAHYSFSAYVCSIARIRPLVVSLMGSDVHQKIIGRVFIRLFNYLFWNQLIVKSPRMKEEVGIKDAFVIPNGVSLNRFVLIDKCKARKLVGFRKVKKYIIWVSNPNRAEKNFELAQKAMEYLDDSNIRLKIVDNVKFDLVSTYMCAADALLLTSFREGSPNVIKEAMACNLPIVSTDVGDVKDVIGPTTGCYICSYDPKDVAGKIKLALKHGRTDGRKRIIKVALDTDSVAARLISVYNRCFF